MGAKKTDKLFTLSKKSVNNCPLGSAIMNTHHYLKKTCTIIGLCVGLSACSAILDTDSLNNEPKKDGVEMDGEPYPTGRLQLPAAPAQEQRLALGSQADDNVAVDFRWEDVPGRPADFDLSLGSAGQRDPIFQVFTRNGLPYGRWGLRVVPLQPDAKYRLRLGLQQDRVLVGLSCLDSKCTTHTEAMPIPAWLRRGHAVHLARGKTDVDTTRVVITAMLHRDSPLRTLARALASGPATAVALR